MDIDWEKRWEEYAKQTGVGFAVNCGVCGGNAGFCKCAKKQWIECEKEKLGLPHEKMFSCDFCGNKKTFVYQTWDLETLKTICEMCSIEKRYNIRRDELKTAGILYCFFETESDSGKTIIDCIVDQDLQKDDAQVEKSARHIMGLNDEIKISITRTTLAKD